MPSIEARNRKYVRNTIANGIIKVTFKNSDNIRSYCPCLYAHSSPNDSSLAFIHISNGLVRDYKNLCGTKITIYNDETNSCFYIKGSATAFNGSILGFSSNANLGFALEAVGAIDLSAFKEVIATL